MIRRLYVDNFRSLVDFTWEPGEETLVLGYNGSGKTSALDALDAVREWACGTRPLADALRFYDLTKWRQNAAIRVECDLEFQRRTYAYSVTIEFSDPNHVPRVQEEALRLDDSVVFSRSALEVAYATIRDVTSSYPVPLGQSALAALSSLPDSEHTRTFTNLFKNILVVSPIPPMIEGEAHRPESRPSPRFENFVAWYWHQTSSGAFQRAMIDRLNGVWEEFDYLDLEQVGRETRVLSAVFKKSERTSGKLTLDLHQMSDGERMLVVLYSLVAYQQAHPQTTIIVDEPDNFVSLLELQPWLLTLLDERPEEGQIILVSHSPEIIRTMGYEKATYFSRADHLSPTLVSPVRRDETVAIVDRFQTGLDG